MSIAEIRLAQPDWLDEQLAPSAANDERAQMREVLALAAENVRRGGGGPFAAAVYALDNGERLAAAVNTVVSSHCAAAHAELQALSLAQQALASHTLSIRPSVLISSSAPCTMCLGAIAWSGIQRLVFATSRQDVEQIGFDEGPTTPRWRHQLAQRGISVRGPLLRREGNAVLQSYQGPVYNGQTL
jgi:tRNA(Arg) A34 adenosine deaminase TadA